MTPVAVKERPILFSGAMVRAILEGKKTQTRRVMKPQPRYEGLAVTKVSPLLEGIDCHKTGEFMFHHPECDRVVRSGHWCPYGVRRDRLWVREAWAITDGYVIYRADLDDWSHVENLRWSPSIHMHRTSSRINLEITDVRVQRVQEITEEEVWAEGLEPQGLSAQDISDIQISDESPLVKQFAAALGPGNWTGIALFQMLWDEINGKRDGGAYAWSANPWVWALTFRRVK